MLEFERVKCDENDTHLIRDTEFKGQCVGKLRKVQVDAKGTKVYMLTDYMMISHSSDLRQVADKLDELNKAG